MGLAGRVLNIRVFGESFVVEQSGDTLTIALDTEKGFKWIYRLDGAESKNLLAPGLAGRQYQTVSRVTWSGSVLTITTELAEDRQLGREFRRLTLSPDGSLRIEAGRGDGKATAGSVYKRFPWLWGVSKATAARRLHSGLCP